METFNRKAHWETIYTTKQLNEVSWYQPKPETSLQLILAFDLPKTAKIIDVGGGDSFLVDHLLDLGYSNVSVLDISEAAIQRAKERLGDKASEVQWIVADASQFDTEERFDVWHDRAAFHFLTDEKEIESYATSASKLIVPNGHLIVGTFSTEGPLKCSGIEIKQYSKDSLNSAFSSNFKQVNALTIDHPTPFDTTQNFVFCSFERLGD